MTNKEQVKIMIVEDDHLLCQLYQEIFEKKGYQIVAIAVDGSDAIKKYNELKNKPDIIIIDFRLPKKNGFEVSQEILAGNHSTEIIMISGDPTFDRKAVISCGINFMQKPVEIETIIREISFLSEM